MRVVVLLVCMIGLVASTYLLHAGTSGAIGRRSNAQPPTTGDDAAPEPAHPHRWPSLGLGSLWLFLIYLIVGSAILMRADRHDPFWERELVALTGALMLTIGFPRRGARGASRRSVRRP